MSLSQALKPVDKIVGNSSEHVFSYKQLTKQKTRFCA